MSFDEQRAASGLGRDGYVNCLSDAVLWHPNLPNTQKYLLRRPRRGRLDRSNPDRSTVTPGGENRGRAEREVHVGAWGEVLFWALGFAGDFGEYFSRISSLFSCVKLLSTAGDSSFSLSIDSGPPAAEIPKFQQDLRLRKRIFVDPIEEKWPERRFCFGLLASPETLEIFSHFLTVFLCKTAVHCWRQQFFPETYSIKLSHKWQVSSPHGDTVHTSKGKSGDKFEFKAPSGGMYKFCFHNPTKIPESISFNIHVGHIPIEQNLAKNEHFDPVNVKIAELRESLESVTLEQRYLKARDARHRLTNESTRRRLIFYTVVEYLLLMLASVLQIWYIRRLFSKSVAYNRV
ncbi:hypothetical protein KFK09_016121 [Dendrobium nobile]|uniref:GOLD domain-containing protein n=1 Tax=Dendrobium nobile TaxID=94219 RepID=A0A8T3AYZ9_DENNO|nr:hypothetical protein KFK09_016121 [Dendrobium nobile]